MNIRSGALVVKDRVLVVLKGDGVWWGVVGPPPPPYDYNVLVVLVSL